MSAPHPLRARAPWIVLLVCGLGTLAVTLYVSQTFRARESMRFQGAVQDIRLALLGRIDTYVALLRAGTGLFAASDEVTRAEFERFVGQLQLRDRFPGVQGIGFARRVAAADTRPIEERVRAGGAEDFRIWPERPVRDTYFPIVFLEPLDRRNRAALGYDMFADATRREAMVRAAQSGRAIASGKVTLVQEIEPYKQAGFLIYHPVYRPAEAAPDPRALFGYVYSPFRAEDLLFTLLQGERRQQLRLRVYDGRSVTPDALLFDSGRPEPPPVRPALSVVEQVDVSGRPWTMAVTTRPGFTASSTPAVAGVFTAGLLVSLLLFRVTRLEVQARESAEAAAAELRRSEEALHAANRAKDEFLATLSHELRTPLNAILGWARMLRLGHLPGGRRENALEIIERNARVQAQLIEDLLDVSRIITGKLRLDLQMVEINRVLEDAMHSVRPSADAKGVALSWTPDPAAGVVYGAPDRIQQIAWNLLSNAIKFTPAGGRVEMTTTRDGDSVRCAVRDTGAGIAPEFLPFVFDRFRQADSTTTRSHSGVGLGLAIVRHLVELHGGTITAESAGPARGACFTVTLPSARRLTQVESAREWDAAP